MIPVIKSFSGGTVRPSDNIDPKMKQNDPAYGLGMSKYIYGKYARGNTGITAAEITNIERNKLYAYGRQDPSIYKKKFIEEVTGPASTVMGIDDDDPGTNKFKTEGLIDMNFDDILSPLPKYIMNLIGIFEDQDHDIKLECEDEKSGAMREEMMYGLLAQRETSRLFKFVDEVLGIPQPSQEMVYPQSLQELSLFNNMGMFKLPWEIGMKKVLNHTDYLSKQPKLKRGIIKDLVIGNMAATISYIDPGLGKVFNERVDVGDIVIESSKEEDFSDATYWGWIKWYSILQVREETGWEEEKILTLADSLKSLYNNSPTYTTLATATGNYDYDDFRVPVLCSYWKTIDTEYQTTRKNASGETVTVYEPYRKKADGKIILPEVHNSKNRKTESTSLCSMYKAKYVIGSEDLVWDFGKADNIAYNYATKDVEPPLHVIKFPGKSIIEGMIPIEDQIQFTFLRLQNAIIKAPPPGLKVEFGSLENMEIDGVELNPIDVLKIYSATGNIFYRLMPTMPGDKGVGYQAPIEELKGGLGSAIDDAIKALAMFYEQLNVISGIDPITSVSKSPTDRQGKAVTEIAVSATSNTLKTIYAGYLSLKLAQSKCTVLQVQSLSYAYDKFEDHPYYGVIGEQYLSAMKVIEDKNPIKYGFKAVPVPNNEAKNDVKQTAVVAMTGGQGTVPLITYSEYLFLVENLDTDDGIKYARLYIAYKEGVRKQEEAAIVERNQKMNRENSLAIEGAKRETRMMEIDAKSKARIAEIARKELADIALEKEKRETEMMKIREQGKLQAKEEPAEVGAR